MPEFLFVTGTHVVEIVADTDEAARSKALLAIQPGESGTLHRTLGKVAKSLSTAPQAHQPLVPRQRPRLATSAWGK